MTLAPLPVTALEAGHRLLDRFLIHREIGRGGHSIVYAARDLSVDTDVALKLLVPPPATAAESKERLRREVQVARTLRHPNIVGVHDFVDDGATAFVVMDLVDGTDLAAQIGARGPFPVNEGCRVAFDLASALVDAHRAGVLHRDIKPANVLVDRSGRAMLADFGSARLDSQTTMTRTGGIVGTLAYLAPEVWDGHRADVRADLYALGITMYEVLTGTLPPQPTRHLPPTPRPDGYHPSALRGDVPPWLDEIVAMMTRSNPRHRFATAAQVTDVLQQQRFPTQPLVAATLTMAIPPQPVEESKLVGRLLVAGVVLSGAMAGIAASPHFLWATPIVGFVLWRGIKQRPIALPSTDHSPPAWELIGPLARMAATVPGGTARELLDDILVLARAQVDGASSPTQVGRWRAQLEPMVAAGVEVARDLAEVDEVLRRMEATAGRIRHVPATYWESLGELGRTRDGLSTALLELIGTLGRARSASVDDFESARFRMEELLVDLRSDIGRSVDAAHELERALRAG